MLEKGLLMKIAKILKYTFISIGVFILAIMNNILMSFVELRVSSEECNTSSTTSKTTRCICGTSVGAAAGNLSKRIIFCIPHTTELYEFSNKEVITCVQRIRNKGQPAYS